MFSLTYGVTSEKPPIPHKNPPENSPFNFFIRNGRFLSRLEQLQYWIWKSEWRILVGFGKDTSTNQN
jgi:hypothetical protein